MYRRILFGNYNKGRKPITPSPCFTVGKVPESVQSVTKEIYENFLPGSKYKYTGTAEFEMYHPGNPREEDYVTEIWIPVDES